MPGECAPLPECAWQTDGYWGLPVAAVSAFGGVVAGLVPAGAGGVCGAEPDPASGAVGGDAEPTHPAHAQGAGPDESEAALRAERYHRGQRSADGAGDSER